LAILAIAGLGLHWASQRVPAFYRAALAQQPAASREASDAMLRQTAQVASEIRRRAGWQALITADQINGWLAVDAVKNHPHLFPASVKNPRIALDNDRLKVAFFWDRAWWSTVVSVDTEVYLRETNVVAIRIRGARAGSLPLPLGDLLSDFIASGRELGLHIDQKEVDGQPLLLVTLPEGDEPVGLQSLELRGGQIYLSGSGRTGEPTPLASRPRDESGDSRPHEDNSKTQR
jgi:hypothetical protein